MRLSHSTLFHSHIGYFISPLSSSFSSYSSIPFSSLLLSFLPTFSFFPSSHFSIPSFLLFPTSPFSRIFLVYYSPQYTFLIFRYLLLISFPHFPYSVFSSNLFLPFLYPSLYLLNYFNYLIINYSPLIICSLSFVILLYYYIQYTLGTLFLFLSYLFLLIFFLSFFFYSVILLLPPILPHLLHTYTFRIILPMIRFQ